MEIQKNDKLQMFEDQPIRTAWNVNEDEWYFSIVDVVCVLTESVDYNTGRKYWNKLKQRLKEEGSELVTNCHQLKMKAADGKRRLQMLRQQNNYFVLYNQFHLRKQSLSKCGLLRLVEKELKKLLIRN